MKEGSYSVEAAFIMPGVVLLVITFLWLGFYMRDVIFTEAFGRSFIVDCETDKEKASNQLREELNKCMWSSNVIFFDVFEDDDKVMVSYKITPKFVLIRMPIDNSITIFKEEKTSEKIYRWRVWIDEAKKLLLTEG